MSALRTIYDEYRVLTSRQVDEDGKPLPKRITGFDVMPSREHDVIMSFDAAQAWQMTPDDFVDNLSASEFMRRVAIVRATKWDQPTAKSIERNKYKRMTRRP